MRLPRDVSGRQLANLLKSLAYTLTSQKGSHMRLTKMNHGANHFGISRDELVEQLFGMLNSVLR